MSTAATTAATIAAPERTGEQHVRRRELAAFLGSRRERVTPEQVGLPRGPRRRTPGLRREEVAQLSTVGVTCTPGSSRPAPPRSPRRCWTPSPAPCSWTPPSAPTSSPWPGPPTRAQTPSVRSPPSPRGRSSNGSRPTRPRCRTPATTSSPPTAPTPGSSATLLEASEEFRALWERHEVAPMSSHVKRYRHPVVGLVRLEHRTMWPAPRSPAHRVVAYVPADEESEERLERLAELSAE